MVGYILETLAGRSWRRDGATFWTREGAKREAERILRRGKATEVRIIPVEVAADSIESLTSSDRRSTGGGK